MTTNKLLGISVGASIVLGLTFGGALAHARQTELATIQHNPQVYQVGTYSDCALEYIRTSHAENSTLPGTTYQEDIYLKSTCEDSSSISKVKGNINFAKFKMVDSSLKTKKLKM